MQQAEKATDTHQLEDELQQVKDELATVKAESESTIQKLKQQVRRVGRVRSAAAEKIK